MFESTSTGFKPNLITHNAVDIIEKVEAQINKPVITSNQAQMWSALRLAGINDNLKGFGQLFGH